MSESQLNRLSEFVINLAVAVYASLVIPFFLPSQKMELMAFLLGLMVAISSIIISLALTPLRKEE